MFFSPFKRFRKTTKDSPHRLESAFLRRLRVTRRILHARLLNLARFPYEQNGVSASNFPPCTVFLYVAHIRPHSPIQLYLALVARKSKRDCRLKLAEPTSLGTSKSYARARARHSSRARRSFTADDDENR